MRINRPIYLGCRQGPGHYLWDRDGRTTDYSSLCYLDGLLPPEDPEQIEGLARLYHFNGVTALAFWDRSEDGRMGSHSTYFFPGKLDFESAVTLAKRDFPHVWRRYNFAVVLTDI